MTVDNSLGNACCGCITASPVDKVTVNCFDRDYLPEFSDIIKNNITLNDVSEICFTENVPDNIKKFKDLGIKLFKIEGEKIVEI